MPKSLQYNKSVAAKDKRGEKSSKLDDQSHCRMNFQVKKNKSLKKAVSVAAKTIEDSVSITRRQKFFNED